MVDIRTARADRAPLRFIDADGHVVTLSGEDAETFWDLTEGLERATVSACNRCRSRLIAVVALADVLDAAPPHPRGREVLDLADDAPTMHLAVLDETECTHAGWRDPGYAEWVELVTGRRARRGR